jgi:hypothetical protein
MARPRAADDFAAIWARMEEIRRERSQPVRHDPIEPSDRAYLYARSRSQAPIDEKELFRRIRGRGIF